MNVSEIMTHKPATIQQNETLYDALGKMEEVGCHHLPVLSDDGHLVGIITNHDCHVPLNLRYTMRDRWRENEKVNKILVRTTMTPAPIVVEPTTKAAEAARLMLSNHISCLPVMRGETLVGIVTISDILMAFIKSHKDDFLPVETGNDNVARGGGSVLK